MKLLLIGGAVSALLLGASVTSAAADGMPRARAHHRAPAARPATPPRRHAPPRAHHAPRVEHHAPATEHHDDEGYHRRYHAEEVEVSEYDSGWQGDHDEVRVFRGAPQSFAMRRYEGHDGDYAHDEHEHEDGGYEGGYRGYGAAYPYTYGYGAWSGYYAGGHRLVGERYWDRQVGPECDGGPVGHGGYERRCYYRREHGAALPHGFVGDGGVGFGVAEGSAFTGGGGTVFFDSRSSSSASASAFARSNAFAYGRGGGRHGGGGHHGGGHHGGGHHGGGHGGHGGR